MKNVLLIDDDKAIHNFVKAVLETQECKVSSAFDPTQAFTQIRKEKPDLILLDIKMPAGGGFELFKRLQVMTSTSAIPIVILSALTKLEIQKNISDPNSVEILSKPVAKDDLIKCVMATKK